VHLFLNCTTVQEADQGQGHHVCQHALPCCTVRSRLAILTFPCLPTSPLSFSTKPTVKIIIKALYSTSILYVFILTGLMCSSSLSAPAPCCACTPSSGQPAPGLSASPPAPSTRSTLCQTSGITPHSAWPSPSGHPASCSPAPAQAHRSDCAPLSSPPAPSPHSTLSQSPGLISPDLSR